MHEGGFSPRQSIKLLFWDEVYPAHEIAKIIALLMPTKKWGQPKEFVRTDIAWENRELVGKALQLQTSMNPLGGSYGMAYMGWADCRICGAKLGTRDMFGYGFIWPEKAEHYVLEHKVWTPECEQFLRAVQHSRRKGG